MDSQAIQEFKEQALYRLDESTRMLKKALTVVADDNIWKRPNDQSNAIGNLILHLCGNITQYAIASLGEQEDNRERDEEFTAKEGFSKEELLGKLNAVVTQAKGTISNASDKQMLRKRAVQGFTFSGIGIVLHVVEHYSYHTGQIAFWVKLLKAKDLGFYEGLDLNIKNKT